MKFPTIKEVSALIRAIKPHICDEYVDEDSLRKLRANISEVLLA